MFALTFALVSLPAAANPASPPPSVTAWDNRASSVMVATSDYRFSGGDMRFFTVGANFTTAHGLLASEFAAHFATVEADGEDGLLGGAISMTNILTYGIAGHLPDGRARVALSPYAGPQPTILVGDTLPRVAVPLALGLGVPIAASRSVLIVPWGELAPALTVEPVLHPASVSVPIDELVAGGTLTEDDLRRMLREGVTYTPGFAFGGRAGLTVSVHSRQAIVELHGAVTQVGWTTEPHVAADIGASIGFHWEDPTRCVPCVAPPPPAVRAAPVVLPPPDALPPPVILPPPLPESHVPTADP